MKRINKKLFTAYKNLLLLFLQTTFMKTIVLYSLIATILIFIIATKKYKKWFSNFTIVNCTKAVVTKNDCSCAHKHYPAMYVWEAKLAF